MTLQIDPRQCADKFSAGTPDFSNFFVSLLRSLIDIYSLATDLIRRPVFFCTSVVLVYIINIRTGAGPHAQFCSCGPGAFSHMLKGQLARDIRSGQYLLDTAVSPKTGCGSCAVDCTYTITVRGRW